jgi:hypothetical protein
VLRRGATGSEFKNAFSIMQNMPGGVEVVYPPPFEKRN